MVNPYDAHFSQGLWPSYHQKVNTFQKFQAAPQPSASGRICFTRLTPKWRVDPHKIKITVVKDHSGITVVRIFITAQEAMYIRPIRSDKLPTDGMEHQEHYPRSCEDGMEHQEHYPRSRKDLTCSSSCRVVLSPHNAITVHLTDHTLKSIVFFPVRAYHGSKVFRKGG